MPLKAKTKTQKRKPIRKPSLQGSKKSVIKKNIFYYLPYLLLLVLFFAAFFSFSVIKNRQEKIDYSGGAWSSPEKIEKKNKTGKENYIWQSFGDNFSSSAYLDEEKTNLVLDFNASALVFPPLYDLNFAGTCETDDCGFLNEKPIERSASYGEVLNISPSDLAGKDIVSSSLYKLEERSVALFIVQEKEQERVYAYFYNNLKNGDSAFTPILNESSDLALMTEYGRLGGELVAAGDDDNFIILYIGYEGMGLHYNQGKISDISRFFGLRMSDNGFKPQIIKQGSGNDSLWFVLNLDEDKFKFFKLWQNGESEIAGIVDLGSELASQLGDWKKIYSSSRGKLSFVLESGMIFDFQDKGFDNSRNRQVQSLNLIASSTPVARAKVRDFYISGNCNLKLSNNGRDFFSLQKDKDLIFKEENNALFLRAECPKSNNQEYSPWLDNINYLDYLVLTNISK